MGCPPLINARSPIGVHRFNGRHLTSLLFEIAIAAAPPSETAAAGARRRMDRCGRTMVLRGESFVLLAPDVCDERQCQTIGHGPKLAIVVNVVGK